MNLGIRRNVIEFTEDFILRKNKFFINYPKNIKYLDLKRKIFLNSISIYNELIFEFLCITSLRFFLEISVYFLFLGIFLDINSDALSIEKNLLISVLYVIIYFMIINNY